MKLNFLIAVAIILCLLAVAMAFVLVTARGGQQNLATTQDTKQPNATPYRWCTVSGMVVDKNKNGIPSATVTLYETRWANNTYENLKPVELAENPQYTVSNLAVAAIGTYTFYNVPLGIYNLTAEKDGHLWFAWVNASRPGTHTNNIAIPDYKLPPESPAPVTPWFTITGMVLDRNMNGVPGAKVILYQAAYNSSTGSLDNVKLADVESNPQLANSDHTVAAIGTYTFYQVPKGLYNVTVEKADTAGNVHMGFAWVNGTAGTQTANIVLPDIAFAT